MGDAASLLDVDLPDPYPLSTNESRFRGAWFVGISLATQLGEGLARSYWVSVTRLCMTGVVSIAT